MPIIVSDRTVFDPAKRATLDKRILIGAPQINEGQPPQTIAEDIVLEAGMTPARKRQIIDISALKAARPPLTEAAPFR